jgi:hypothetical protein
MRAREVRKGNMGFKKIYSSAVTSLLEYNARHIMTALPDIFGNSVVQGLIAPSAVLGSFNCELLSGYSGLDCQFMHVASMGL